MSILQPTDSFGLDDLLIALGIFWFCFCAGIALLQFSSAAGNNKGDD